jgi:hypothetical protein
MQTQNLLALLDRPIAYHRILAEIGGSVTAGVFLSQAVYWSQRTDDPDGWFWKTQKEWQEETYLKRSEQEIARRELRAAGILEEKKKGVPAKLYFRLNAETLNKRLLSPVCQDAASLDAEMQHAPFQDARKVQSRMKSRKGVKAIDSKAFEGDLEKTDKDAESSILSLTETTSETTSEISKKIKDPPISPQRGDEGVANAALEQEVSKPNGTPATKSNAEHSANPERGHFSERRREVSKSVQNVRQTYRNALPDWRWGYGSGEYHAEFERDIQRTYLDKLPEISLKKQHTPAQMIEEAEAAGSFANLESRCKAWRERQQAAAQTQAQTSVPIPPTDRGDELALLEVCLKRLRWNKQQAIDHMVEHCGWPRRKDETYRDGRTFNMRVISDAEILQLTETLEQLCTPPITRLQTP